MKGYKMLNIFKDKINCYQLQLFLITILRKQTYKLKKIQTIP